jgi:hypothetical protein
MFNQDALSPIRAEMVRRACSTEVQVLRDLPQSDGIGGITSDWRLVKAAKARIVFTDGKESLEGGVLQARSNWQIYMPTGTFLMPKDRVKVVSGTMRQRVFNIKSVDYGRSDALLLIADADVVSDTGVDAL